MHKRGEEAHARKLGAIRRGDYIAERLDNVRFHVKVKIAGLSKNLELVQRSVQVYPKPHTRNSTPQALNSEP